MLSVNLIDLDHLLANPVFDSSRCSIGYHLLHGYEEIALSIFMLIPNKTRIFALGLILHFFADYLDCKLMLL